PRALAVYRSTGLPVHPSTGLKDATILRPHENHTAAAIVARELQRNRRRAGVDLDPANVVRRRQQIEVERTRQRHLVEIDLHRARAELRVAALARADRVVLRDWAGVVRRHVYRFEFAEELRRENGVARLDVVGGHEFALTKFAPLLELRHADG